MFSPEFTKFLMTYQMDEYKNSEPEKKYIRFKNRGGRLAEVKLVVRK